MNNLISKLVWLIIIAPAIYLAFIWNHLPATVALHYDLQGNSDRYGSKKELIGLTVILITINIFVYFLLTNIHRIDPKKYVADNKDRLRRIAFAVAIFMSALVCFIIYTSTLSKFQFNAGIIFSAVGLLFAVIGNYLPNLKPNYFAGLRLPWTLENPDNWRKTHALAGKLWFFGGLFVAVTCFFTSPVLAIIIFSVVIVLLTIVPCVYSYQIYKNEKENKVRL